MNITDPFEGDKKIVWTKDSKDEAEKAFKEKLAKGWMAYTVDPVSKESKLIKEFDEDAQKIVLTPPATRG